MAMQPNDIILSECFNELKFHSSPFAARAAGVPCRRTDPEPQQPASINAVGNVKPWMFGSSDLLLRNFSASQSAVESEVEEQIVSWEDWKVRARKLYWM